MDFPRKLQRSLSSNLISEMSREELKRMAEHAKNREEDLLLAAKLGMELQREVEDKTEKLREMENLVTQLQEQTPKNSETKSYVVKADLKETEGEEDKEEESDPEANDDFHQFFRNHLIANLQNMEEPSPSPAPSPLSSPLTSPAQVPKTLKARKKLTEQQIKGLTPHQLFVEYKRYIRETLRRSQEKLEGKEEEMAKIRDQLATLSSKADDNSHKKLIIHRLQNELEQTQLRAAQREIELKAEMRRLVAMSATSNHSPQQSSSFLTIRGERERKRENFSEVSSDSEQDYSDADKEAKGQEGQSRKKTRDQLHLTLNLPQIYAHGQKAPDEEDPPVLSPSLTRHIYRLPSGAEVPAPTSSLVSLVKNVKPKAQTLSAGTNYPSHNSLLSEDSETEVRRPLIKGGGVKDSGAGCWNQFQGWDLHTCSEISSSHFISDFSLWVFRLIVLVIVWGVIIWHFVWRILSNDPWWQWFIFLTDWDQLIVGLYFLFAVIYSPSTSLESNRFLPLSSSFGRRVTFVLFEVAFATALTVSIMFWSVIFKGGENAVDLAIDINVHGVIAFWMFLELLLNRIPFLWSHIIWEVIVILSYLLFNYLYTVNVHTIYDMVTYKSVQSTEVVAGCIILSLGCFALGFALAALRDFCMGRGKAVSISYAGAPYTQPRHSGDWGRAEGQPLTSDQKEGAHENEDPRRTEFYEEF